MRLRVCSGHWGAVSRIALVGLIGSAAAACSTDSARFAENPFSNPFAASERMDTTASMAPQPAPSYSAAPMPTPSVQAQALPPVQSQPLSQPTRIASAPAPVQARPMPVAQAAPAQPASRPQFRLVGALTVEGVPHLVRIERNAEGELTQTIGAPLRISPLVTGIAATL